MVFISGIPECFAYGAYETTSKLAAPPNTTYIYKFRFLEREEGQRG